MKWFEVLLIAASVLFVLGVTVAAAVKRKKRRRRLRLL